MAVALNHLLPRNLQSMCSPLFRMMSRQPQVLSRYCLGARSHRQSSVILSFSMLNRQWFNVGFKN